jgi:hypothetical protein
MTTPVRLLLLLIAGAVAVAVVNVAAESRRPAGGALLTEDGDTVLVTDDARAATLRYAPAVPAADRAWIAAALAAARPEAASLLAEVDGLVTLGSLAPRGDGTLGVTQGGPSGFTVDLDFTRLDGDRAMDRMTVVLHEMGHVIDFALVDAQLAAALDAQIPRGGPCGLAEGCDMPEERFADTFAKWALRGAVSEVGAGYGVPTPASIEGWGAPLGALALSLPK